MTDQELKILQKYASMTEQEFEILKKFVTKTERELKVLKKHSSKTRKDYVELYNKQNEELALFIKNMTVNEIVGRPTNFIYIYYWYFVTKRGNEPLSQIEFSRRMVNVFDIKIFDRRVKGVKCRVFDC